VLLAGIYNIPLLLQNHTPPRTPTDIARIYRDIVEGAFGMAEDAWEEASPALQASSSFYPKQLEYIVIGYSAEDELVERKQGEDMLRCLKEVGWCIGQQAGGAGNPEKRRGVVEYRELKGSHDFAWEDGEQIARLILETVELICSS
jgi:hypothetical protein